MADVTPYILPDHAHIPGQNARPPDDAFAAIKAQALNPTTSATAAQNRAFQAGLDLLENGFYWEAHEVLEAVWMNAPANTPERHLVQALIQLANAALKHRMGRPKAVARLTAITRNLLSQAGPPGADLMGLDLDAISTAVDLTEETAPTDSLPSLRLRPE